MMVLTIDPLTGVGLSISLNAFDSIKPACISSISQVTDD